MINEDAPLVTAVIPVYNHEQYVVETIRSLVGQTYRNLELIIINDGSKDRSHAQVLSVVDLCKERFAHFEYISRHNIGLTATLNQALGIAHGKYFSVMGSDDIALPGKIEVLVNSLETKGPEYAAAFGNASFIDGQSRKLWLNKDGLAYHEEIAGAYESYLDFRTDGGRHVRYRGDDFGSFASLLAYNYLPAVSNLVRTEAIRQAGGWTNGNASEDWEMWRKLSKCYRFVYVDKILALYRWHVNNSVKVSSSRLNLCSLRLLMQEEKYCAANGLTSLWRAAYASLTVPVLLDNGVSLKDKASVVKLSGTVAISSYAAKRLLRKVMRLIT